MLKGTIETLHSREQTGKIIYESANYITDLGEWLDTDLQTFFNFVKNIPYKEDPKALEIVSRPKYLLDKKFNFHGIDCKKKAVLLGAWLNAHNIPWRLLAVSERPDKKIHHVFIQAYIEKEWKNVDATLPTYKLFEAKPFVTHGEILADD